MWGDLVFAKPLPIHSLGVVVKQHCLEYLTRGYIYSCGVVSRVFLGIHADYFPVPLYSGLGRVREGGVQWCREKGW